ncbi:OpgC domain-containing protein, partial [uncultured Nitratireductor sp.]|uniref:OpgC domain-containing protein n=1 Tax=uncultured Nitratireductor sp. TaxID=520953 RepID=UPI0025EC14C1
GIDKTFLSVPRLLHVMALAYVLTNVAWVLRVFQWPIFRPVELMGKNGLAVFATGSVLAIALQILRLRYETDFATDAALLGVGIAIQYTIAWFLSKQKEERRKIKRAAEQTFMPGAAEKMRLRETV